METAYKKVQKCKKRYNIEKRVAEKKEKCNKKVE